MEGRIIRLEAILDAHDKQLVYLLGIENEESSEEQVEEGCNTAHRNEILLYRKEIESLNTELINIKNLLGDTNHKLCASQRANLQLSIKNAELEQKLNEQKI